nr:crustacyanin-A2 subunit-like isoform X3 [Cherax quadricarinatus]
MPLSVLRECLACVVMVVSVSEPALAWLGIPEFLEFGDCANVTLKTDFDPVKYAGLWFDIESVPNEYQHTKQCIIQYYTWTGTHMDVATRGLSEKGKKVQQGAVMHKEIEATDNPDPAYMTVVASGVPEAPYQIVATDYRSYSCVYSCIEYFGFRAEFSWVFGRTPTLPPTTIAICHHALTTMGVDPEKMNTILQGEECPYSQKLETMLAESEQYLLEILGPYVPTTTTLPPVMASQDVEGGVQQLAKHRKDDGAKSPNNSNSRHSSSVSLLLATFLLTIRPLYG